MELLANGEESILDEESGILTLRDCLEATAVDYTGKQSFLNMP